MRIVVTGIQGQLAQSLVASAQGLTDITVVPVGRPALDLLNLDMIEPALVACAPDVIVNAAAYTAVDQAENEPEKAHAINAAAAGGVAQAAARLGVPVLQISTDYVFDGTLGRRYRETDAVGPLGVYGRTKREGEIAVAAATSNHAILRTGWVYSPFARNFVKTMLHLGETRPEVAVVADQHGSPTSALDLAAAIITIARRLAAEPGSAALRGTFHAAGSGEATWADLAEATFREASLHGRPPVRVRRITTADYPALAQRPCDARLDGSKLAQAYAIALPDWRISTPACVRCLLGVDRTRGQVS